MNYQLISQIKNSSLVKLLTENGILFIPILTVPIPTELFPNPLLRYLSTAPIYLHLFSSLNYSRLLI